MSINSYLEDVASKLIIRDDEREAISKSVDVFKDRMKDYFDGHESVDLKEIKIFGSYDRDTDLPQSIDYDTDVDIMLVMNDDGCSPQTYLDRVKRAVEAKYSTSDIVQSSPTIVLRMNHIKFEITPALNDGIYHIKDSNNRWIPTYCFSDLSNLADANKANNNMIKPVIRLVKYWNVDKNYKSFSSYQVEKKIVNYYLSNRYMGYNTKEYLLFAMKQLRDLVSYESQRKRLENTISKIGEAIEDEPKYKTICIDEIKEVINKI